MATKVNPIPEGYHSIVTFVTVKNADKAIEFYKNAFGAKEIGRIKADGNKIMYCELQIGDSRILLTDEFPEMGNKSPETLGGSPVGFCLYVENADKVYKRALELGASIDRNMEMKDQFYGDRSGTVKDPFGHHWTISTHIEDVPFDELQKRSDEMMKQHA